MQILHVVPNQATAKRRADPNCLRRGTWTFGECPNAGPYVAGGTLWLFSRHGRERTDVLPKPLELDPNLFNSPTRKSPEALGHVLDRNVSEERF